MSYYIATAILLCFFTSCGRFDLELFRVESSALSVVPPVGGACSGLTLSETNQTGNVSANVVGHTVTFTNDSGQNEEAALDFILASPAVGITYIELTYVGNSGGLDANSQLATIFARTDFSATSVIRIFPGTGRLADDIGNTIISGLTITPGYTVGFWLDRSSGTTNYKDSLGNSGVVETVPGLIGQANWTGTAGMPNNAGGATIISKINVGQDSYVLTPPVGATDWCGNNL